MFKKSARRTASGIVSLAMLLGTAGLFPVSQAYAASSVTINEVCPKNTTLAAPDDSLPFHFPGRHYYCGRRQKARFL